MKDSLRYKIALSLLPGLKPQDIRLLLEHFGSAEAVFLKDNLELTKDLNPKVRQSILQGEALKRADEEMMHIEKNNLSALFINDDDYPARLRTCPDAPIILYSKGFTNLNSKKVVAIVGTRLLPVDWDQDRYSPMLAINYAITNKSAKTIKQIKGSVTFTDLTGDEIGVLWADIDKTIPPGKTIETDTGRGFKLNEFMNEDKERIAGRKFSDMKAVFTPESIAFDDGEVIKAPDLQE